MMQRLNNFCSGHAVLAMVHHQIRLIVCSVIAQPYTRRTG